MLSDLFGSLLGHLGRFPKPKKALLKKMAPEGAAIWDPAEELIYKNTFSGAVRALENQYNQHLKDPAYPRKHRNKLFGFGVLGVFVMGVLAYFFPEYAFGKDGDGGFIWLVVLPFVPFGLYLKKVKDLQKDLVKLVIAKGNHWIYSPDKREARWRVLRTKFPELFEKGDEAQNLQDEFWGNFKGDRRAVDFWTSIFEYTVVHRDSKGKKTRQVFTKNAFSFRLVKPLRTRFCLKPEKILSKIRNFFTTKEVETESIAFNKAFAFYYDGAKADKELEMVKTLSPAVQLKLLDLKKTEGPFSVLFSGEVVIFLFEGVLLKKMHTNFFKKVEVASQDKKYLRQRLEQILEISDDIVQYLH